MSICGIRLTSYLFTIPYNVNCYVFSLAFAFMGSLQGKVFSDCKLFYPSSFRFLLKCSSI